MTYQVRPAKRSEAKPLIGLYSESGCGKTYTSLLLARGFVGSQGKIIMIETESGRGEAYADPKEYPEIGGYDVVSMRDNFSPEEYGKAITAAEQAKPDALIIDSASHEWEGAGGVLDMAAKNQASGKKGPIVWQQPKIQHQTAFMLRFMQTPIPLVILNMRAKYPMAEVPDPRNPNKKVWQRSDVLEPKQSEDILYEMFVHGWIDDNHNFHMTKCTAKSLEAVFGQKKPISIETGQSLAQWAAGSSGSGNASGSQGQSAADERKQEPKQQAGSEAQGSQNNPQQEGQFKILPASGNPLCFQSAEELHKYLSANVGKFKTQDVLNDFTARNEGNFDQYAQDDTTGFMQKVWDILNKKKKEFEDVSL